MVTLKTPEAPATNKQLWLLHLLTKTDTRNLDITMQEASNRIEELKSNGGKSSKPQGDTARADYRVSGIHPQPEREVIQGDSPQGVTDMAKIEAHFKANCYELGRTKAENDTARIDFYDFSCKECLFGKTGICEPSWREAGFITGGGVTEPLRVESVSFDCNNHEPIEYRISEYCHRPKGKRCHRKGIDNPCLECNYRKPQWRDGYNHSAWARYIPTIPERIRREEFWLDELNDKPEALAQVNNIIRLLNKLVGVIK